MAERALSDPPKERPTRAPRRRLPRVLGQLAVSEPPTPTLRVCSRPPVISTRGCTPRAALPTLAGLEGEVPILPLSPMLVRDRAVLLRIDGHEAGSVTSLTGRDTTLGRAPECDVVIDDASLSRHHARLLHVGGRYFVEDLGSRNGTFVQAERVSRRELGDDDRLQLGPRVTYRFAVTDTREEDLMRRLWESSTQDALTGTCNRRQFQARFAAELAFARRHGSQLAVLLFDIDHFKAVNDRHGHATGDLALKHVAATMQRELRAEDLLARLGGEEFCLLLRETAAPGAQRAAERIRQAIGQSVFTGANGPLGVTVSCGVATLADGAGDGDDLLACADRRLYAAKGAGRNRVVCAG